MIVFAFQRNFITKDCFQKVRQSNFRRVRWMVAQGTGEYTIVQSSRAYSWHWHIRKQSRVTRPLFSNDRTGIFLFSLVIYTRLIRKCLAMGGETKHTVIIKRILCGIICCEEFCPMQCRIHTLILQQLWPHHLRKCVYQKRIWSCQGEGHKLILFSYGWFGGIKLKISKLFAKVLVMTVV